MAFYKKLIEIGEALAAAGEREVGGNGLFHRLLYRGFGAVHLMEHLPQQLLVEGTVLVKAQNGGDRQRAAYDHQAEYTERRRGRQDIP